MARSREAESDIGARSYPAGATRVPEEPVVSARFLLLTASRKLLLVPTCQGCPAQRLAQRPQPPVLTARFAVSADAEQHKPQDYRKQRASSFVSTLTVRRAP